VNLHPGLLLGAGWLDTPSLQGGPDEQRGQELQLGIHLFPNLRLRNGTDGLEPLAAGYPTAVLASCTDLKQPANYHWWHDLAENVDFDTVADGIRLSEAAIRRLDTNWF